MRKQVIFPLFILLAFYSSSTAICVWTGAGDGTSFSDDLNWSCGHMPLPMDEIILGPGAMVTLDVSALVKSLELDGGTLSGTEMLEVADAILWKSGTIDAGVTLLSGTMSMVPGGSKELDKILILKTGTLSTWSGGSFYINSGGELILEMGASFGVAFDGTIDHFTMAPGKIISSGFFEKAAGPDTAYIKVLYENEPPGILAVASGTMQMVKGILDNVGTMHIDSAALLQIIDSSSHDVSSTLSGKGTLELIGVGPHIFAGTYAGVFSVIFDSDVVVLDGPLVSSRTVEIKSGIIEGTGSLGVDSMGVWSGGVIDLPVTVSASAMLSLSGGDTKILSSMMTQSGSATWTGGDLAIQDGGTWSNVGIFTAASSGNITFFGSPGTFSSSGSFLKTAPGELSIAIPFSSSGLVGGIDTVLYTGGIVNTGTFSPGLSPGVLVVDGDYSNGKVLELEVKDDSGVGTGHDQLVATGMVSLSDTLRITETGTVPNGTYMVLRCEGGSPCITGSFVETDIPGDYTLSITSTEISVTKSALPVDLVYFKAKKIEDRVLLEWETASETDNAFFAIERSTDGYHFDVIGRIVGQGVSGLAYQYQWYDRPLSAGKVLYYRLHQMDYDGTNTLSDIRAVQWQDWTPLSVDKVVWNSSQELEVFIAGNQEHGGAVVSLVSLSGHLLGRQRIQSETARVRFELPEWLTEGMYVIEVLNRSERSATKVVRIAE